MRSILPLGLGLALVGAGVLVPIGVAPAQERPDDAAAIPASRALRWTEGWEAGRETARTQGRLMFVFVHRSSPP